MARAHAKVDSVYDFIYVDARRIAVLLSQLDGATDGVLTELTRDARTGSGSVGTLSVHFAKVDGSESESVGLTRKFDPQWLAPLRLLDLAHRQERLNRDPSSARFGELVLFQGELKIRDFRTVRAILSTETLKSRLANNLKMSDSKALFSVVGIEEGKTPTNAQLSAAKHAVIQLVFEIIAAMPGRAQMIIKTNNGDEIWGALREDGMIVSHEEIALTHGSSIPGTWIGVGLLDGLPDTEPAAAPAVAATPEGFVNSSTVFSALARKLLGRPFGTYAVTPLMIFRDLAAE